MSEYLYKYGGKYHQDAVLYKRQFCCGVEHEVENCDRDLLNFKTPLQYKCVDDGSLVEGTEIITNPSSKVVQKDFFKELQASPAFYGDRYSERTSTHVHVNVAQLTPEELYSMVMLYSLTEPYLFAFVGAEREHNIHCVPLWATHMNKLLVKSEGNVRYLSESWHKYTALNLKTIYTINTVEFRHLFGTSDFASFSSWLDILEALYNWTINDAGAFYKTTYNKLGVKGYQEVKNYLFTQTGFFGQYLQSLSRYANQERCYDVYLNSIVDLFPGVQDMPTFMKD